MADHEYVWRCVLVTSVLNPKIIVIIIGRAWVFQKFVSSKTLGIIIAYSSLQGASSRRNIHIFLDKSHLFSFQLWDRVKMCYVFFTRLAFIFPSFIKCLKSFKCTSDRLPEFKQFYAFEVLVLFICINTGNCTFSKLTLSLMLIGCGFF